MVKEVYLPLQDPEFCRTNFEVSIILVTYNSRDIIGRCLRSIVGHEDFEIIVVDNASVDGTAEYVAHQFPSVRILETGQNLGFAKGVNFGVERATGSTIVLLNPDAVVDAGSVNELHRLLVESPGIGVIAPLLEHPGRGLAVREGGMRPSIWRVFCHYYGLSRILGSSRIFRGMYILRKDEFSSIDVDWVSGACMAVPHALWKLQGGLSERWFMYAEDVEFCLRVRSAGLRVVITASSTGIHGLGESSSTTDESPSSVWLLNLYDLYRLKISNSRLQNVVWKYTFGAGLIARAVASAVIAVRRCENPKSNQNYRRFREYSNSLLSQSSAVIRK